MHWCLWVFSLWDIISTTDTYKNVPADSTVNTPTCISSDDESPCTSNHPKNILNGVINVNDEIVKMYCSVDRLCFVDSNSNPNANATNPLCAKTAMNISHAGCICDPMATPSMIECPNSDMKNMKQTVQASICSAATVSTAASKSYTAVSIVFDDGNRGDATVLLVQQPLLLLLFRRRYIILLEVITGSAATTTCATAGLEDPRSGQAHKSTFVQHGPQEVLGNW